MKTLYTAKAMSIAGREGHTETDDKRLSLELSQPGGEGTGPNPEQLFACSYSACFGSAVASVAKAEKVHISDVKVWAEVNLNQDDEGGYFLAVELDVTLAGVDDEMAGKLVEKAHQVCPYSKATRGNIEVVLKVNDRPLVAYGAIL
ncbi:MAG: organic hydroperoxide resistance protein [Micavibrio sp.]